MFVCEILSRFTNQFEGGNDQIAKVQVGTLSGKENVTFGNVHLISGKICIQDQSVSWKCPKIKPACLVSVASSTACWTGKWWWSNVVGRRVSGRLSQQLLLLLRRRR